MAYTKQDYDNVVSLFREYESKKDSYTPIQQKQIENAFANAWSKVSGRTQETNYKTITWTRVDPQWNTYNQFSDWSEELVKSSEKPNPEIMNTNNINVPETQQAQEVETQITPAQEPAVETAAQVQTKTPANTNIVGKDNTWVYPVWSAKNGWTLMSDWSVRPASYNPNASYNQPKKKQTTTTNPLNNNQFWINPNPFKLWWSQNMNTNVQRLLKSWYKVDQAWYLYNPSWKQVARIWTWWMASNP